MTTLFGNPQNTAQHAAANTTSTLTVRRTTPYGATRGPAVAWNGDHGFLDGPTDTPTALTHLGAREYDPTLARFLSVDPIIDTGDPLQMSAYTYAQNNPITLSDPDGKRPLGAGDVKGAKDSGCTNCRKTKSGWKFGNENHGARSVYGRQSTSYRFSGGRNFRPRAVLSTQRVAVNVPYPHPDRFLDKSAYAWNTPGMQAPPTFSLYSSLPGYRDVCTGGTPASCALTELAISLALPGGGGAAALRGARVGGVAANSVDDLARLTASQQRSVRSLQGQVQTHQTKLGAYRANPDAYDNLGILERAPTPEIRQRMIDGRIRHLETEIRTFQDQIDKLLGGG